MKTYDTPTARTRRRQAREARRWALWIEFRERHPFLDLFVPEGLKSMSTVQDVWGFSSYLAVDPEGTLGTRFLAAMNAEAVDRGIKPNVPSDALDASRLVILMDAAAKVRCNAEIVDGVLRIWPLNVTIDWAAAEAALA